ncbi:MAG: hypothetical protein A2087_01150 [Spirochaetes bacterium GWD1_61_31]|nr:MAG: hypothetical protein A2Y37_06675 [Spirochaetes bacterium GWB1_60_80]OHD30448.1 MAG: hypothetical protein A2004_07905 [Spirochaetes bacterium GWC1_61_12]OHD41302.1 MAG: hypothetical protein A2087_01150 [Spirochaetes bacterium GWD1_61_31]OHD44400.1 MAG: hypothetical protein A2Y35_09800 [Spirochaetes bacterium GWE1_60_18]OHD60866.1 MAG: hypothetical protein A2Y32_11695 [Spirochaetes bacterium GWF1_60_12]HAP43828.1 hypothetical protein [Spirochaetaceae bacterium]
MGTMRISRFGADGLLMSTNFGSITWYAGTFSNSLQVCYDPLASPGPIAVSADAIYACYQENTNQNLNKYTLSGQTASGTNYLPLTAGTGPASGLVVGSGVVYLAGTDGGLSQGWCSKINDDLTSGLAIADVGFNKDGGLSQYRLIPDIQQVKALTLSATGLHLTGTQGAGTLADLRLVTIDPTLGTTYAGRLGDPVSLGQEAVYITDVLALRDGSLLAVGAMGSDAVAFKLDAAGAPVAGFGNTSQPGLYQLSTGGDTRWFQTAAEAPNGDLLLGGWTMISVDPSPLVIRVDATGSDMVNWTVANWSLPPAAPRRVMALQCLAWGEQDIVLAAGLVEGGTQSGGLYLINPTGAVADWEERGADASAKPAYGLVAASDGSVLWAYIDDVNLGLARMTISELAGTWALTEAAAVTLAPRADYQASRLTVNADGRWRLVAGRGTAANPLFLAGGQLADLVGSLSTATLAGYNDAPVLQASLHPDGRLFIAYQDTSKTAGPRLLALGPDLSLDVSFASGGVLSLGDATVADIGASCAVAAVRPDGSLVRGGSRQEDGGQTTFGWLSLVD